MRRAYSIPAYGLYGRRGSLDRCAVDPAPARGPRPAAARPRTPLPAPLELPGAPDRALPDYYKIAILYFYGIGERSREGKHSSVISHTTNEARHLLKSSGSAVPAAAPDAADAGGGFR